jgi:hypothetical protein
MTKMMIKKIMSLMIDQDSEEESSNHNEDFCEMVCQMLHSQTQVHIFHLGTKSYAEHKALTRIL